MHYFTVGDKAGNEDKVAPPQIFMLLRRILYQTCGTTEALNCAVELSVRLVKTNLSLSREPHGIRL